MGFGSEILFVMALGLVVLGPKRLHTLLGQLARAKAQLEKAGRGFTSQLGAELDLAAPDAKIKDSDQLAGD